MNPYMKNTCEKLISLYFNRADTIKIENKLMIRRQARGAWTDKKEIKFSSYIRKFRMEQLQSHIWLTASSYMEKYLRISSYIMKPFLIYDFATAPLWISLNMRKILFSFLSVWWLWSYSLLYFWVAVTPSQVILITSPSSENSLTCKIPSVQCIFKNMTR